MVARLENLLKSIPLASGAHKTPADGVCVMECVAYLQGEPYSDHPECACPVITAFVALSSDVISTPERQILGKRILRIAGSRSTPDVAARRLYFLVAYVTRTALPRALSLANLEACALPLTRLPDYTGEQLASTYLAAIDAARIAINDQFASALEVPRAVVKARSLLDCAQRMIADLAPCVRALGEGRSNREMVRMLFGKTIGAASVAVGIFKGTVDRIALVDALLDIGAAQRPDTPLPTLLNRAQLLAMQATQIPFHGPLPEA